MIERVVLVDSGPLYAIIHPRDQYYEQAHAELAALAAEQRIMSVIYPTVLVTYSLILKRHPPIDAINWIRDVVRNPLPLEPTQADILQAFETVQRFTDQRVTLFDAVLATFAIRSNLPVWTYDHHFDTLGATRWHPGS